MKFSTTKLDIMAPVSTLKHWFAQAVSTLLVMGVIWQSMALGADASVFFQQDHTLPLFSTSANSISKQVTGKAEQLKGSAKESMGKAQSTMENRNGAVKRKVKNDVNETSIAVDSTKARAENAAENAVDTVKGFFGK